MVRCTAAPRSRTGSGIFWRASIYEGLPGNRAQIFVDGEPEPTLRLPMAPDTPRSAWRIGGAFTSRTPFRGEIDDVRVYSRALRTGEIQALYRCSAGLADAGPYYMFPIFGAADRISTVAIIRRPGDLSSAVHYLGKDVSGVQLGKRSPGCAVQRLEGADAGQDLYFGMDLRVPRSEGDELCSAGPYFRSRRAAAGDGIIGGTSAGYAVLLRSDGEVAVRCLNPHEVVAYSPAPPGFDGGTFHKLEVAVRGMALEASLDGAAVEFTQAGKRTPAVSIPPTWEQPRRVGINQGAAGIALLTSDRGRAGGQQARNFVVAPYRPIEFAVRRP